MKSKDIRSKAEALPFGSILSRTMESRGLTMKQVAEISGVSVSVVSDWTAGGTPHNIRAVAKLAKALGMSLSGLLLGEPELIQSISSLDEVFEESEVFEGLCKVSIRKVKLRKERTKA